MNLPFISSDCSGIGGCIKQEPSYFVVTEIPLYEASGEGEHIYVTIRRTGMTTQALRKELARLFKLHESAVGFAGLKDKHAAVTQTFSLHLHHLDVSDVTKRIEDALPVVVTAAQRHNNKLRRGHLRGNHFDIVITNTAVDAQQSATQICTVLVQRGVPNFYGIQRFGIHGDNAARGKDILLGAREPKRWLRELLVSAYTSKLFNKWLAQRMMRGDYNTILVGDVAKKTDTGGLFIVDDRAAELPRFINREITYTGPIFGSKMKQPAGTLAQIEEELICSEGITHDMFRALRAEGSRRAAQIFPENIAISPHPEGLRLSFFLPKGSYATTVLREFMKTGELDISEEDE